MALEPRDYAALEVVSPNELPEIHQDDLKDLIREWLRDGCTLWLGAPCIALVAVPSTTCKNGSSNLCVVAFSVFVIGNMVNERFQLQRVKRKSWFVQVKSVPEASQKIAVGSILREMNVFEGFTGFLTAVPALTCLGLLEMVDVLTDYLFPAVARACDSVVTPLWVRSWEVVPLLGTTVASWASEIHFWGFATALVVVSVILMQGCRGAYQTFSLLQALESNQTVAPPQLALAAEFAGHMVLSELFDRVSDKEMCALQSIIDNWSSLSEELEDKVETAKEGWEAEFQKFQTDVPLEDRRAWMTAFSGFDYEANFGGNQTELFWQHLLSLPPEEVEDTMKPLSGNPRLESVIEKTLEFATARRPLMALEAGLLEVNGHKERGLRVKRELVTTLLTRMITKVFGENVLQMLLQSSYFGFTYRQTSLSAKLKMGLTLFVGAGSALSKSRVALKRGWDLLGSRTNTLLLAIASAIVVFVFYTALKIVFCVACEGPWNLTTGCVTLEKVPSNRDET